MIKEIDILRIGLAQLEARVAELQVERDALKAELELLTKTKMYEEDSEDP